MKIDCFYQYNRYNDDCCTIRASSYTYCHSKYFMYFCCVFNVCENSAKMNKTIVIAGKDYPLESGNIQKGYAAIQR